MNLNPIFECFEKRAPVATMTRGLVEHLFSDEILNPIAQQHRIITYTRSIEFSHLVQLVSHVVFRVHPSVRAAHRNSLEAQKVATLKSFYSKFNRLELAVSEALVETLATHCQQILGRPDPVGIRYRLIDGNQLSQTQKRLDALTDLAAPLPGQIIALQDLDTGLFMRTCLCLDGHANERSLFAGLSSWWAKNDCIIGDTSFCTERMLRQLEAKQAYALIRHHGSVSLTLIGEEILLGHNGTALVFESRVRYAQTEMEFRCFRLKLDQATQAGHDEIRLLTTLPPSVSAFEGASRYLDRRGIEDAFQDLEGAMRSEVETLGRPQAALFAISVGLVLFNILQVIRQMASENTPPEPKETSQQETEPKKPQAKASQTEKPKGPKKKPSPKVDEISGILLGQEIDSYWAGLCLFDWPKWVGTLVEQNRQLGEWLRKIVRQTDWNHYRTSPRGPKKPRQKNITGRKRTDHNSSARAIKEFEAKKSNEC